MFAKISNKTFVTLVVTALAATIFTVWLVIHDVPPAFIAYTFGLINGSLWTLIAIWILGRILDI